MLTFNHLLADAGYDVRSVRLLRHQESGPRGLTPYRLWRDNHEQFVTYQEQQHEPAHRDLHKYPYWASFVVTPAGETLFAGMYAARFLGRSDVPMMHIIKGTELPAGQYMYSARLHEGLREYIGRVIIEWGKGTRKWAQRADLQPKPILEIRTRFEEPAFPGFLRFVQPLSRIEHLPATWASALSSVRGVYLLTSPRTRELYVGSAYGSGGFMQRWLEYARNGHGENVQLKLRSPSDHQVSILEVSSSSASDVEIIALESLWKQKLQSREMGLNSN